MPLSPQANDFMSCPVCLNAFSFQRKPITLSCCHTCCSSCLRTLQRCPFDQAAINRTLPENEAILSLTGTEADAACGDCADRMASISADDRVHYESAVTATKELAALLRPNHPFAVQLSRPMQRKLISLLHCQLMEAEGRGKAIRASRSIGERALAEFLIRHQDSQNVSKNLWAAVRTKGCQFLGPAMQEEVLKLVLLALGEDAALSRKVLVMFVVQRLSPLFPHQASMTAIGHVIQLLYRASCFKLTKREADSSLMQLKKEYASYEALRREHDTQIVSIAVEAGLRISPDQWSSLLYGDTGKKAQMQSIIDKLQSPHSFNQSMQELLITLERSGDPAGLSILKPHFEKLSGIDAMPLERDSSNASPEIEKTTTSVAKATDTSFNWTASCLQSACIVTLHLMQFLSQYSSGHFRPTNGSPSASFLPSARHVVACDRGPVLQSPSPFASRGKRPGPRNMRSPDPSFT